MEEQKKVLEDKLQKERVREDGDTQSVFDIRKMYKFGTNDFQCFLKKDNKNTHRPYSAYNNDILDSI